MRYRKKQRIYYAVPGITAPISPSLVWNVLCGKLVDSTTRCIYNSCMVRDNVVANDVTIMSALRSDVIIFGVNVLFA